MQSPADLFRAMASRIEAMKPEEFAGAILIVPPDTDAQDLPGAIEVLTIEAQPDIGHFWGGAKIRVDAAAADVQQALLTRKSGMGFR